MGDRAVYCARLESVCAARHRGFESPPIRHVALDHRLEIGFAIGVRLFFALILLAAGEVSFAEEKFLALTSELATAKEQYLHGKFEAALAMLDRSDKSSGATLESLDLRGCIYLEQGKFDDAAKSFESAHFIKFDAFSPQIHFADALLRQKKFEDALHDYQKLTEVKLPMWPEYARFGVFLTYLVDHHEEDARRVLATIIFPTESPSYYYAQAAWSFAHGKQSEARNWISNAKKIFDSTKTAWFDRALHHFGWIKKKPAPALDPFS